MQPILSDSDVPQRVIQDHLRLVYSAALRQTRDTHLAEDVTQAVLILFLQKHRWIPAEHIAGWLVKTAYFTSRQALRTEQRRTYHEKQAAMNIPRSTSEPSSDLSEVLDRALSRLAMQSRTAVALRYLEGRPVAEVAHTLRVSENAASKIITRGLNKLRGFLQNENPNLSLAPDALMAALLDVAAKSPIADISHLSAAILSHGIAPKATSAALAHATGKMLLWAKLQTTATILCTVLVVVGTGGIALHETGWMARAAGARQPRLQFRLVEKSAAAATQPFTLMDDVSPQREKLPVDNQILLDESSVESAEEVPAQYGSGYSISVKFTPAGGNKFSQITGKNIGRRLAIIFDGKIIEAPRILSQVGNTAILNGGFSKAEADAIVAALNSNRPSIPATQTSSNLVIQDFDSTLGPMIELPVANSSNAAQPAYTFVSMHRHRALAPPPGIPWNPAATLWPQKRINDWVINNEINLLITAAGSVRVESINCASAPTRDDLLSATTDSVKKSSAAMPWTPYMIGKPPLNFYLASVEGTAMGQISADPLSNKRYLLRYRLLQLDPSKPTGRPHVLGASEFLYASPAETGNGSLIQLITTGARPFNTRFPSTTLVDAGGLFLNGQLLATGQFEVWTNNPEGNILANFDIPIVQARAIADLVNRETSDNGYKRFVHAYSLNNEPLRYIAPPFIPERQMYTFWPTRVSVNTAMIFHRNDPKQTDYVENFTPQTGAATYRLADVIYSCCSLKKYEFFLAPALRSITLPGDFIVDHSATPQARLKALQHIFTTQIGRPIKIEMQIQRRPVIVALGHYDFTPLPQAKHADAIAFAPNLRLMDTTENGGSDGSWQEMLDTLGDIVGVRMVSLVDNPPAHIDWINYSSIWDIYSLTAQSLDQPRLNALLQNLSTQTNLDFKIETRDEPTYVISPGP